MTNKYYYINVPILISIFDKYNNRSQYFAHSFLLLFLHNLLIQNTDQVLLWIQYLIHLSYPIKFISHTLLFGRYLSVLTQLFWNFLGLATMSTDYVFLHHVDDLQEVILLVFLSNKRFFCHWFRILVLVADFERDVIWRIIITIFILILIK